MMVYIFDAAKRVRKILSPGSITELVHDEGAYSLSAAISMDAAVKNGEHIGFKCVDGHFRIFTVTKSENFDDNATCFITARDAIVMELMETIVEDLQQLELIQSLQVQKKLLHRFSARVKENLHLRTRRRILAEIGRAHV